MRAINTRYGANFFRSRTEARWAVFFDACGIPWDYERAGYELRGGRYLPDFWLPTFQMYLEIKGELPTDEEKAKCIALARESEKVVLLAVGVPEERFQIRWFDASGEDDCWFAIARDRNAEAGYWLVSDDDLERGTMAGSSRWFGGGSPGIEFRGGAMFSGALEQAYRAAQEMRFEHGEGRQRVKPIREMDPARVIPFEPRRAEA